MGKKDDGSFTQSTVYLGRRYGVIEFRCSFTDESASHSGGVYDIPAVQAAHTIGYQKFRVVNIERDRVDMIPLGFVK